MARIVITEFMDQQAVDRLSSSHDVLYDPELADDPDRLLELVADADALIVRNRTRVTKALVDAGTRLSVVGRLGVGLDNIHLDACAERGIPVRPATGANSTAVAEYVLAAMLLLTRRAFDATDRLIAGEWPRVELRGGELQGRTLGLIGFGGIARKVADRALAFDLTVVASDPFLPEDFDWGDVQPLPLDELASTADIVSVHVPLLPDTHHLINEEFLDRLPDRAIIINTARGEIVDHGALVSALQTGKLSGAALDVFESEPLSKADRTLLADCPNLLLTPHIAGVTHESTELVSKVVADAVLEELDRG